MIIKISDVKIILSACRVVYIVDTCGELYSCDQSCVYMYKTILTLGRPKWVIRDPMSQHFNKFMRLNADNSFMLRVFLNCVYLLYYATC